MSAFSLTMLPAAEGDSLILSYGPGEDALSHIVIDGGRAASWPALRSAMEKIAERGEEIELLLLSHIDADHLDGFVKMMKEEELPLVPKEIWFNGYDQVKSLETPKSLKPMGYKGADSYTKALAERAWKVNERFDGGPIVVGDEPMVISLGELTLSLISPDRQKLEKLRKGWDAALAEKPRVGEAAPPGMHPFGKRKMPAQLDVEKLSAPSKIDAAIPNGSSIAMVAEYGGRRVLLAADAHPDLATHGLTALGAGQPYRIDLAKLPHHGSRSNVTEGLIRAMDCRRFAISTSGAVFGHPDPEAISRLLMFAGEGAKELYFNYASPRTTPWDDDALKAEFDYRCVFPDGEGTPTVIDI